jgi:hypothetical protein
MGKREHEDTHPDGHLVWVLVALCRNKGKQGDLWGLLASGRWHLLFSQASGSEHSWFDKCVCGGKLLQLTRHPLHPPGGPRESCVYTESKA